MSLIEPLLARLSARRVLALALALRVLWVLACPNEPTSDQAFYHNSAVHLSEGLGYARADGRPVGYFPVGYQALLAPFYRVFGPHHATAYGVNVGLGLLTVLAAYLLARELFGERGAVLAATCTAVYPTFVMYTTMIASENAVWPGSLLFLWLATRVVAAPRVPWGPALAAGVLLGLSGYVRSTTLLLSLALPLLAFMERLPFRQLALRTSLVAAVSIAVLAPWALRNHRHFGRYSPVSINAGSNFWMGNHEGASGGYTPPPAELEGLPLVEREERCMQMALEFVRENPGEYARLCARRVVMTLRSDTIAVWWNRIGLERRFGARGVLVARLVCHAGYLALLALTAATVLGRVRHRTWGVPDTLLAALVLVSAVPFVFIVGGNRYHLPLLPLLCVWIAASATGERPERHPGPLRGAESE